jgi:hypothetical protein
MIHYVFSLLFTFNLSVSTDIDYKKADSTIQATILRDSLRTADSIRVFKKQSRIREGKKIFFGGLMIASASAAVKNGIETDGYPMLFWGIIAILSAVGLFRKNKLQSYEYYKQKKENKKNPKYNKSWLYGFGAGAVGFILAIMSIFPLFYFVRLGILLSFFVAIFFFIRGFKGKYVSKWQFAKRFSLGFLGLLMPYLPFAILAILFLSGRGE